MGKTKIIQSPLYVIMINRGRTYKYVHEYLKTEGAMKISLSHVKKIINGEIIPQPRTWWHISKALDINKCDDLAIWMGHKAFVMWARSYKNISI